MQIGIYMNAFNRLNLYPLLLFMGFPGGPVVKKLLPVQEMWVWSMGWDDPPGGGNDNPPQYPYLGNKHCRYCHLYVMDEHTETQMI